MGDEGRRELGAAYCLKYNDRTDLAPWMARWMIRAGAELLQDAEIIVPVPLHWRRFFSRRFNQSAELARAIATLSAKRFEPSAVRRVKVTRQQVGLGLREREDNVRGAFRVLAEAEIEVRGRHVLDRRRCLHDRSDSLGRRQSSEESGRDTCRHADFCTRPSRGLSARGAGDYIVADG